MPFALFLALKYLKPKRSLTSAVTVFSVLGVVLGVAIASLFYAYGLYRQVNRAGTGTPKMQEVAAAIREGANPLDFWVPTWLCGFPLFRYYQPGPYLLLAALALTAGLYHTLNHALFKGLLFLGAGSVLHGTGTREIDHLGGLLKRMPWTGATSLVGAAAIELGAPLSAFQLTMITLTAALPSASNVSLLAERYGADNGRVARDKALAAFAAGTPFDLRPERSPPATLGAAIAGLPASADGKNPGGIDHNYVVRGWKPDGALRTVALLRDPASGRTLEILTDQPGIQVYTGNYLDGSLKGKGDTVYGKHAGICLETQKFPDSIHHAEWPATRPSKPMIVWTRSRPPATIRRGSSSMRPTSWRS